MRSLQSLLDAMRAQDVREVTLYRIRGMASPSIKVALESVRAAAAEPHAARGKSVRVKIAMGEYHLLKAAGAVVEDPTLG